MCNKKVGTKNPTFLIIRVEIKNKEMGNKIGYFNEYKSSVYNKSKHIKWNVWQ